MHLYISLRATLKEIFTATYDCESEIYPDEHPSPFIWEFPPRDPGKVERDSLTTKAERKVVAVTLRNRATLFQRKAHFYKTFERE